MHRTWMGVAVLAAALAVGCGQGRVIFNVDAYSFFSGSGKSSVPYAAPPAATFDTFTVQKVSLPGGLGSSVVDTVQVSGNLDFQNQGGGPGTIRFQVYLAADSAGTFSASADTVLAPPVTANVSLSNTTSAPFSTNNLSPNGNSLFTGSEVWFRVKAHVSNTSGTLLHGNAVLTALQLRVVVQDKVF